jgi:hypothetical protein
MEVDLFLNSLLNLSDTPTPDLGEAEVNDAVTEFFERQKLAGTLGWETAENFSSEAAKLTNTIKARGPKSTAPAVTDDAHCLQKRYMGIHSGKKAHRIEKSANGQWVMEYDAAGALIRGYQVEAT